MQLWNVIRYFPTQLLNFLLKDTLKRAFASGKNESYISSFLKNMLSGSVAGAISLLVVYPLDTLRTIEAIGRHWWLFVDSLANSNYLQIQTEIICSPPRPVSSLRPGTIPSAFLCILDSWIVCLESFSTVDPTLDCTTLAKLSCRNSVWKWELCNPLPWGGVSLPQLVW